MQHFDNVSFVLKSTGTVAGTWLLEGSNNFVTTKFPTLNNATQAGNDVWANMAAQFTTITQPTGTAQTQYIQNTSDLAVSYLRLTFTPSGGAGSVAAYVFRKGKR
jgi:hypothetical protein